MIKCVVWDLDDTLWEGVLLEDRAVRLRACRPSRPSFPALARWQAALDLLGVVPARTAKSNAQLQPRIRGRRARAAAHGMMRGALPARPARAGGMTSAGLSGRCELDRAQDPRRPTGSRAAPTLGVLPLP